MYATCRATNVGGTHCDKTVFKAKTEYGNQNIILDDSNYIDTEINIYKE